MLGIAVPKPVRTDIMPECGMTEGMAWGYGSEANSRRCSSLPSAFYERTCGCLLASHGQPTGNKQS